MLLLTGQVGIGLRALFTPKVLYGSEIEKDGHTVGILLISGGGGSLYGWGHGGGGGLGGSAGVGGSRGGGGDRNV